MLVLALVLALALVLVLALVLLEMLGHLQADKISTSVRDENLMECPLDI